MQKPFEFELSATDSYMTRRGIWIYGGGSGDGILVIVVVSAKAYKLESHLYGLEEVQPKYPSTRAFQLVRATGNEDRPQEQPYVVTTGKFQSCTCDSGRMGRRRGTCKHLDAVTAILAAGKLPTRQLQGA
jgi:hypothetical protein